MVAQIDREYVRTRPGRLWPRLVSYGLFEGRPLTTRGQWINPLVFAHFALEKRLPQLKRVEAPIFILGTGQSGTTILGVVLSMHREVGFLNEPKALWHALHGGEDLIGNYSHSPARYRLDAGDADAGLVCAAHRLYGAYPRASGTRRLVDKYPELIIRLPFISEIFPDARFLFLSRDGWDTCGSIAGWSDRLGRQSGSEAHDWWGADRRKWNLVDQIVPEHPDLVLQAQTLRGLNDHRAMATTEWIVTMRDGLQLCREHPDDVLHMRYEHLCATPGEAVDRIAAFAGLASDLVFRDYAERVLTPPRPESSFDLPEPLVAPFAATQAALGRPKEVAP